MIEALSDFPDNVVAFACHGHVTRDEYKEVLIPRVDAGFEKHKKLRLYYQIGDDFTGIDPGAVWQDFAVGMEHVFRWERIAVVTDVAWITNTMNMVGFLMPAEMRVFSTTEEAAAREWIVAK